MQTLSAKRQTGGPRCISQLGSIHQNRSLSQRRQISYWDIFTNSGTKRMRPKSGSRIKLRGRTLHPHGKLPEPTVGNWMRTHRVLYTHRTTDKEAHRQRCIWQTGHTTSYIVQHDLGMLTVLSLYFIYFSIFLFSLNCPFISLRLAHSWKALSL